MKKIVITGGHLTPAIAVIEALKAEGNWEIYFFGRKYAMEADKTPSVESNIIPTLDIPFFPLVVGRLQRHFTRYGLPSLLKIPIGFFQAFFLLLKVRPSLILSFGGYVSVPTVLAGWLLRIPILTHEQTTVFGLASKINSFFADRIAVSFTSSLDHFLKKKVVFTGNPLRKEIFSPLRPLDPEIERIVKKEKTPLIYVTGGNQGAHVINMAVAQVLEKLIKKFAIIHQSGEGDYDDLLEVRKHLSPKQKKHYLVIKYIGSDEIGWVFQNSSLVVSRAGANTVTELAALGKPSILIPIPWSYKNEQMENARMLERCGFAKIIPQKKLSGETLKEAIEQVFHDLETYKKKGKTGKSLIVQDADKKLVAEIKKIAR